MASAAAVAVDAARSPLNTVEVDEAHGITSKITAADDSHTGLTDDDEDEDITTHSRARRPQRAVEDDGDDVNGDEDADLFGEEEDEPQQQRRLDDELLDSGDDEGRMDRAEQEEQEMIAEERTVQDVTLPRLPIPDPSDGEMYLLTVPKFLSIEARAFTEEDFQPPTADHHAKEPSKNFSAYHTALSTLRWRRSLSKPEELQSNARINRWSDGSLTLQFASNPTVQYEINGNSLAPPQRNPIIPTPTSVTTTKDRGGREGIDSVTEKFDASKHAFTYMAAPMPSRGLVRITNVLTAGLNVSPPADFIDEAIINLQSDLAAAQNARTLNGISSAIELIEVTEDPELAKKRAEQAEREKARARKKQEAQMERERERSNRTLGRSGLSSSRFGGGLSAGMLEDDDGLTTTRGRPAKPKAPRRRRANSEYSSEEDYGRNRFKVSKEDDYDVEDDFVAGSDEEEEVVDDDEDEDDGIIEEGRTNRDATPKRGRDADDEEDAEGEVDDAPAAERKRRRVVVADDDDDE